MERKLILYISMSLDGFIATQDDDLSWLSSVEDEGQDYGYEAFTSQADTYLVGRKTYEVVKELCGGTFPQASQYDCYVVTRQELPDEPGVTFYKGNLSKLVENLKSKTGKHLYCDGGGTLVKALMEENLIDEYIISIIPVLLGSGKRLFQGGLGYSQTLELLESKAFPKGLVQVRYRKTTAGGKKA